MSNVQKARSPSASRPWPPPRPTRQPPAARPGLMAPRSVSMALQASALGELRGALCSISCQPSAAEFCSPTPTTNEAEAVSAMSAEAIGS